MFAFAMFNATNDNSTMQCNIKEYCKCGCMAKWVPIINILWSLFKTKKEKKEKGKKTHKHYYTSHSKHVEACNIIVYLCMHACIWRRVHLREVCSLFFLISFKCKTKREKLFHVILHAHVISTQIVWALQRKKKKQNESQCGHSNKHSYSCR